MATTVEEVGRLSGEPRLWIVDEGDHLIAVCYSRERAEWVATALNEAAALRARAEAAEADRDTLHEAVMLCLAGLVPTPERGYLDDLRPSHAKQHALAMRGVVEALRSRAEVAEGAVKRVEALAERWGTVRSVEWQHAADSVYAALEGGDAAVPHDRG